MEKVLRQDAAALGIYAEQSAIREDVTAEDVKHQLLGMASEQETLLSYFRLFIRNFEKRVGINRTEKTLRAFSVMPMKAGIAVAASTTEFGKALFSTM